MWFQLGPQRLVESVGEVRGRDAQGVHQRLKREMAAQRLDEGAVDLDSHRHLLRVAEHQALELREQGARLEVGQDLELLPRDSEPLSEGRVVHHTVAAPIELRCPNVGELPQLRIEGALAERCVPLGERGHRPGMVGHEPVEVQPPTAALRDPVVRRLHLGGHLLSLDVGKPRCHARTSCTGSGSAGDCRGHR